MVRTRIDDAEEVDGRISAPPALDPGLPWPSPPVVAPSNARLVALTAATTLAVAAVLTALGQLAALLS